MTKQPVGWAKDFSLFQCIWSCFGTYTVFYSIGKSGYLLWVKTAKTWS